MCKAWQPQQPHSYLWRHVNSALETSSPSLSFDASVGGPETCLLHELLVVNFTTLNLRFLWSLNFGGVVLLWIILSIPVIVSLLLPNWAAQNRECKSLTKWYKMLGSGIIIQFRINPNEHHELYWLVVIGLKPLVNLFTSWRIEKWLKPPIYISIWKKNTSKQSIFSLLRLSAGGGYTWIKIGQKLIPGVGGALWNWC